MSEIDALSDFGWSVYPSMVVKERVRPYCKCIGAINKGRVSQVYWMPCPPPKDVKEKMLKELKPFLSSNKESCLKE